MSVLQQKFHAQNTTFTAGSTEWVICYITAYNAVPIITSSKLDTELIRAILNAHDEA